MSFLLIFGLALLGASGVFFLRSFAIGRSERRRTLDQIAAYGFSSAVPVEEDSPHLRETFGKLTAATGEKALARFERLKAHEQDLRQLLTSAGMYGTSVASFVGLRILTTLLGPGLLFLLSLNGALNPRMLLAGVVITVMGWFVPYGIVQRRARLRVERIDREVPELVDLLVTTIEAGVGFAAALQLASRSIEGPLGQELRLSLREQSLGLTPEEALRNLSVRVDSPATRAFTQALVQGESLGVSIGTILRDLAIDMRKRRRQAAEERAQKTPTKILFPLIGLILPALFIMTLGPVLLEIVRFLSSS
jgi:tight adherence protein C